LSLLLVFRGGMARAIECKQAISETFVLLGFGTVSWGGCNEVEEVANDEEECLVEFVWWCREIRHGHKGITIEEVVQ